jgi:glycyl-tRNA synthetase alpha subunit
MKRIKAVIMFFLIFSSVSLAAFSFTKLNATEIEEQVLFEDNFESYSAGTFPSSGGWELWFDGEGAQHQVILQNVSASPTKSLKLFVFSF